MESEVIVLDDSGDESTPSAGQSSKTNDPTKPMPYTPGNYSDILPKTLPLPPNIQAISQQKRNPTASPANQSSSKKPKPIPPFALFAREQSKRLQHENPSKGFGDIGREMGEMWHALPENQREEYRNKARALTLEKYKTWERMQQRLKQQKQRQQSNNPQPGVSPIGPRVSIQKGPAKNARLNQKGLANNQTSRGATLTAKTNGGQVGKPKRTYGYAIFHAEKRKQYLEQGLTDAETSQFTAQEWGALSPSVRKTYEVRATRMNLLEESKRLKTGAGKNMTPPAQRNAPRKATYRQSTAPSTPVSQLKNLPSSTSLRITKVTTLAEKPSSSVAPKLNLPSGISISRVEPEISIISEEFPRPQPKKNLSKSIPPPPPLKGPLRKGPVVKNQPNLYRGSRPAVSNVNRTFNASQRVNSPLNNVNIPQNRGNLKRPISSVSVADGANKTKTVFPRDTLHLGKPMSQGKMIDLRKNCRLCAASYPRNGPLYELKERPILLEKIYQILGIKIDPEKDLIEGYPIAICRKCCHSIFAFETFKKSVVVGMTRLTRNISLKASTDSGLNSNPSLSVSVASTSNDTNTVGNLIMEVESASEMSILPDLDTNIQPLVTDVRSVNGNDENSEAIAMSVTTEASSKLNIKKEPIDKNGEMNLCSGDLKSEECKKYSEDRSQEQSSENSAKAQNYETSTDSKNASENEASIKSENYSELLNEGISDYDGNQNPEQMEKTNNEHPEDTQAITEEDAKTSSRDETNDDSPSGDSMFGHITLTPMTGSMEEDEDIDPLQYNGCEENFENMDSESASDPLNFEDDKSSEWASESNDEGILREDDISAGNSNASFQDNDIGLDMDIDSNTVDSQNEEPSMANYSGMNENVEDEISRESTGNQDKLVSNSNEKGEDSPEDLHEDSSKDLENLDKLEQVRNEAKDRISVLADEPEEKDSPKELKSTSKVPVQKENQIPVCDNLKEIQEELSKGVESSENVPTDECNVSQRESPKDVESDSESGDVDKNQTEACNSDEIAEDPQDDHKGSPQEFESTSETKKNRAQASDENASNTDEDFNGITDA